MRLKYIKQIVTCKLNSSSVRQQLQNPKTHQNLVSFIAFTKCESIMCYILVQPCKVWALVPVVGGKPWLKQLH